MNEPEDQTGFFLFSFDTELSWGWYDCLEPTTLRRFGALERRVVGRLLDILDNYEIAGTWAVVGHMFYERCEGCEVCPVLKWKGKYASFNAVYETDSFDWYGPDIINAIHARGPRQEIAFHGYTHQPMSEETMNMEDAQVEIEGWLRVAGRKGIVPQSVVFPRNRVGHLDEFRQAGFICYRGKEVKPKSFTLPFVGKVLNHIDLVLQMARPQVYDLRAEPSGLVNLPASRSLFGVNAKVQTALDALGFGALPVSRIIRGVEEAIRQRKVIHIWAHPHEFRTDKDFEKLELLLSYVSDKVAQGRLQSVCMAELARLALEQRIRPA